MPSRSASVRDPARPRPALVLGGGALVALFVLAAAGRGQDPEPVDFARDVRPILSDTCYLCHGPDPEPREAELRFDLAEEALRDRGGYAAVVPGESAASELIRRITDPDDPMPPRDSGKSLSPAQIETLRRWIDEGAAWERHWAYVAPRRSEPSPVAAQHWPRGTLDRFVLSRIEAAGLTPQPPARSETLARRVTLDLTGLPPTLYEIDAFVADAAGDPDEAYERLVDRLLHSSRYGEHMARAWLDLVRYADTHGLSLDNERSIWPYREWVIDAFNANLPFDRFTIEQLAGDLLPLPTRDQLVATGFIRNNPTTSETGVIDQEYLHKYTLDRVDASATIWLGTTMTCAQCHDHKFDPITQKEFYAFYAFFLNQDGPVRDGNVYTPEPTLALPTPEQAADIEKLRARIARAAEELVQSDAELDAAQAAWEGEVRARLLLDGAARSEDELAAHLRAVVAADPTLGPVVQGNWWVVGPFPEEDGRPARSTDFGPEADPSLATTHAGGLRWVEHPEWEERTHKVRDEYGATYFQRTLQAPETRLAPFSLDAFRLKVPPFASDDRILVWLNGELLIDHHVEHAVELDVNALQVPLVAGENQLLVKAVQSFGGYAFTFEPAQDVLGTLPRAVVAALASGARSAAAETLLRAHFRRFVSAPGRAMRIELELMQEELVARERAVPRTLIARDRETLSPAFVLTRGHYDQPGEEVWPQTPAFLPALAPRDDDGRPASRLDLARWLVDPANPLTARVTVNHFWQEVFGTGLVASSEDFGAQGTYPSHPELLDWLAVEFVASGWDVKALIRRLVTSATYRQRSSVAPAQRARDPENRLLARGPRYRLDAERIRDSALAISGLLVERLGGPSVRPYQPGGLWKPLAYVGSNTGDFRRDRGEALYRRSLYTFWKRTSPPPSMQVFDAPTREACTTRRPRTNTPLQALALMNDEQFVEAARALAARILNEGGVSVDERLVYGFRLATARRPDADEVRIARGLLERAAAAYAAEPDAADALLTVGESVSDPTLDVAELAAWTVVANLLLNLDEVVTQG